MSVIYLLLVPLLGLIFICSKIQSYSYVSNLKFKNIALKFSVLNLLISLYMFTFYHFSSNYFQFVQNPTNENYFNMSFGVDGSSMYFVLLTTIIIPISLLSNWNSINTKIKPFLTIILLLETLLLSIFLVLDGLLFYVFFESILPPLFVLIGMFGSADKVKASFYLFLYTLLGSLFMLLSILKISNLVGYTQYDAVYKSNIIYYLQIFLFIGIFIAFAVKTPTIFLNNWLLKAHVESPLSGSIILAGIVLKLSLYGVFRLMLPLLAKACFFMTKFVYVIGFLTVIYGSASTIRTIDVKELIAYSSVCHAAVYLMGVFSNVVTGIEGGILLGLAHGFVSSGLFLCVGGVLYDRSSTRLITIYRGMTQVMPIFSVLLFILCLGNCGAPLTLNFVGEFMSLYGVFEKHTLFAPLASLSIILSAGYTIYLFNRIAFAGSYSKYFTVNIPDVNKREFYILFTLVMFTIVFGIYPAPLLDGIHYNVSMLIYNLTILPILINKKSIKINTGLLNNHKYLVFNQKNITSNSTLFLTGSCNRLMLMSTSTIANKNIPDLFKKKLTLKRKAIITPFDQGQLKLHNNNMSGYNFARKAKYSPPATKEWYNSVYHYNNKGLVKFMPVLDKTLHEFMKTYFNLYSKKLEKNVTRLLSVRRHARKEMQSTNKIIVSRPELKHTNDKIIVNAYTYDGQNKYFLNKAKKLSVFDNRWGKKLKVYPYKKILRTILVNLFSGKPIGSFKKWFIKNKDRKYINKKRIYPFSKLVVNKYPLINVNNISFKLKSKLLNHSFNYYNYLKNMGIQPYNNKNFIIDLASKYDTYQDFISRCLRREIISIYYKQLIVFRNMKFEKKYLLFLSEQIKKFYDKNIHFNFVNLKHLYLNSDLFSTALIIKIKKSFRKNRNYLRIVKKSLLMMEIPKDDPKNIYKDIYKKETAMQNLSLENNLKSILADGNSLNNVLLPPKTLKGYKNLVHKPSSHPQGGKDILGLTNINYLSETDVTSFIINSFPISMDAVLPGVYVRDTINNLNISHKLANIIKSIKYKSLNGIRIEIAGRLNKRSKATRSIFKIRHKGNIRNIDSSDKGLSTVLLRGHYKSNLQYSNFNSKLRGGSFGTKVFISGK